MAEVASPVSAQVAGGVNGAAGEKPDGDHFPPATAYRMSIRPGMRGNFDVAQSNPEAARKVNELLQKNMDSFEIIYFAGRHGESCGRRVGSRG